MNHLDTNGTALPQRKLLPLSLAAAAAVAALFGLATPALAQLEAERPQEEVVTTPPDVVDDADEVDVDEGSAWSVSAGSNFVTSYYFRGIIQQPDGLLNGGIISQPYIELGVPIIVPEDESYSVSATVGIWNSFGSEQDNGANLGPEAWYESDLYAGLAFSTGGFEFGAIYTFYTSPNGSFATVQEILGYVGYTLPITQSDDGEALLGVDLGAALAYELENTAFGSFGAEEGIYLEFGAAPGFAVDVDGIAAPVSLSFPATVGLSLEDYYVDASGDNEFLGYVSVAAAAEIPLPVPERYGAWSITPAVEGLFLFSEGLELINEQQDDVEFIGSVSVDFAF